MKLVINSRPGGFGLSLEAVRRYHELSQRPLWIVPPRSSSSLAVPQYWLVPPPDQIHGHTDSDECDTDRFFDRDLRRDDPLLIRVIEELGERANGRFAHLKIVDIPDDVRWHICEVNGDEWVAEAHRTWE